ncbi:MAG: hypothetical protein IJK42_10310 [Prevotella sp.]|nr:hypothetical protein [Prevotella sp.]
MEDNVYTNPIMIDVAHNIINIMFVDAIKEKRPKEEIFMYREELNTLHAPNPNLKRSVFDKAINYYSPIVKARYARK